MQIYCTVYFPGSLRSLNLFSIFLKTELCFANASGVRGGGGGGEGLLVLHFSLVVIDRLKFIEYAVSFLSSYPCF